MRFRRDQQRRELAEHVGADRLALEGTGLHPQLCTLGDGDGEMIGPEGDQSLDEPRARLELLGKTRLGFGEELRLLDRRLFRRFYHRGLGFFRLDHCRRRGRRHGRAGRSRARRRTRQRTADGRFRTGERRRGQRHCLHRGRRHPGALFADAFLLQVIGLESLGSRGRSVVADQRDIGRPQFFQEKAARIAGRLAQPARPRPEPEPVERRHDGGAARPDRHLQRPSSNTRKRPLGRDQSMKRMSRA